MSTFTRLFRTTFVAPVLCAAFLAPVSPARAQTPVPLLVDTAWLDQHLNDRDLVILHVGAAPEYDAGHITGARRVSEEDLSLPHDMSKMSTELMLELPPFDVLRTRVAALGISDNSRIIVYAGKSTPLQSATRIVFTLDYLGLGNGTSLLNGGVNAWTRGGKSTVTQTATVTPGTLTMKAPQPVVADAAYVKSVGTRPNEQLVDARAAVFYRGLEASMGGEKGHIPGALSIPFSELTDNNQMIDRDRIAAIFQTAGIKPGSTIVAYCHVGQQATAVIFASRLLGHPVRLYDGSFQDWTINVHGPVEK